MKILFYLDPSLYDVSAGPAADFFGNWIYRPIAKHAQTDCRTILPETAYYARSAFPVLDEISPETISEAELKGVFGQKTLLEISEAVHLDCMTRSERDALKGLVRSRLGDWRPDLVFTFYFTANFLKEMFPEALVLSHESAVFSRFPFPRTIYYDPCGNLRHSFPNKFHKELSSLEIDAEADKKIELFKKRLREKISADNPYAGIITEHAHKFSKNVLLPLQYSGVHAVDTETDFKTQYEYVRHVMDSMPRDVGVFVTQHGFRPALDPRMLHFFREKYPNFIYLPELHSTPDFSGGLFISPSLFLFQYVDAVINISSATAIMAMLWDNRIISMAKHFNDWMKDAQGLDNIEATLSTPAKNKNAVIQWYLSNYILFDKFYLDGKWLLEYFSGKLAEFREHGIRFEYFGKNAEPDEIFEYILSSAENAIAGEKARREAEEAPKPDPVEELKGEISAIRRDTDEIMKNIAALHGANATIYGRLNRPSFWQKIFSVRNEDGRRVMRILGAKFIR